MYSHTEARRNISRKAAAFWIWVEVRLPNLATEV